MVRRGGWARTHPCDQPSLSATGREHQGRRPWWSRRGPTPGSRTSGGGRSSGGGASLLLRRPPYTLVVAPVPVGLVLDAEKCRTVSHQTRGLRVRKSCQGPASNQQCGGFVGP